MATTIQQTQAGVGLGGEGVSRAAPGDDATAIVHPAGSPQVRTLLKDLGSRIPVERRTSACAIETLPEGEFLTYALGVPLRKMRDPAAARGRVPVTQEGRTR